jgi:hypothetical protein
MARTGDVDGLWRVLTTSLPGLFGVEETFQLLARAIQVRSRQAPAAFAAELYSRMVGFVGYLTMRTHLYAGRLVAVHDRHDRGFAELPRELTDVLLPRLVQLQEHLAELMSAQAATARLWALTRQKEIDNGRAVRPGGRPGDDAVRQGEHAPALPPACVETEAPPERERGGRGVAEGQGHDPVEREGRRVTVAGSPAEDGGGRPAPGEAGGDRRQDERPTQGVGPAFPRS